MKTQKTQNHCLLCQNGNSLVCLDCQEEHWIDESGSLLKTSLHVAEDGTKEWTSKGKLHRTHGPAVEHPDGTKYWYLKGKLHRTDGPAIEYPDGTKRWFLEGKRLTESRWEEALKH